MNQHKKLSLLCLILMICCIFAMSCQGPAENTDGSTEASVDNTTTPEPAQEKTEVTDTAITPELEYKLSDDGKSYSVIGIGNFIGKDLIIPAAYEGKPVVAVGNSAFKGNETIESVSLSTKNIEGSAFEGCKKLKTVILSEGVEAVASGAFVYCDAMESISLPKSLKQIETYALHGCKALKEIKFAGTKAEWAPIVKEVYWDSETGKYTVKCSDGDIAKVEVEV